MAVPPRGGLHGATEVRERRAAQPPLPFDGEYHAHRRLDAAVFAAYGWPADLGDEQILERLLALNLARAGAQA